MAAEVEDKQVEEALEEAMEIGFEALFSGAGLAEVAGWSEQDVEAVYALGHNFYLQGSYKKAEEVFAWLGQRVTPQSKVFMGLGAARQMRGHYAEAVDAYALAAALDLDDPMPSFHAAQCLLHMNNGERALRALEAARMQAREAKREDVLAEINEMSAEFAARGLKEQEEGEGEEGEHEGNVVRLEALITKAAQQTMLDNAN